jgi:hypothetical protein
MVSAARVASLSFRFISSSKFITCLVTHVISSVPNPPHHLSETASALPQNRDETDINAQEQAPAQFRLVGF